MENNQGALDLGQQRIEGSLDKIYSKLAAKGKITEDEAAAQKSDALSKVTYSTDMEALADCDLVIEAIVENVEIKVGVVVVVVGVVVVGPAAMLRRGEQP